VAEEERSRARARIEHVVVLMLENRAFDHMFAFLMDAGLPTPDPGDYPNRLNPRDEKSPAWGVTEDASYALPLDPPHSHLSVRKQLNGAWRPRMNGFVAAYAEKAAGKELHPDIHWNRIKWLAVGLAPVIAGAALLIGFAPRVVVFLIGTAIAVVGWWLTYRWRPPGLSRQHYLLLHAGPFLIVGLLVAEAFLLHSRLWSIGALVLAVMAALAVLGLTRLQRKPLYEPIEEGEQIEDVAGHVMRCMPEENIPVLSMLAKEYALCTNWHCSVPGATWPNRNFAHAATSDGSTDIEIGLYESDTIFERLSDARKTWSIYYDGIPQVLAFKNLWIRDEHAANWFDMSAFPIHARSGSLPAYSFIEPRHRGSLTNSQHPGNNRKAGPDGRFDFERAEQLISDVYEALRSNYELFARTLLVITYDEHGGLFDHAPPPTNARAPTLGKAVLSWSRQLVSSFVTYRGTRFHFRMLGPRVPAVIVSPWIPRGLDATVYDHSSIPATLRRLFAPTAPPLTRRDRHAKTFEHLVVELNEPRPPDDLPPAPPPPRIEATSAAKSDAALREPTEPPPLKMEFDLLADKVRAELSRLGVTTTLPLDSEDPHWEVDPYWDVTNLFHQHSGDARHRAG
jgi:phospholipase C